METREILSESMENYLGTIYNIVAHKQAARSKDIAESLRVTAASVTSALRLPSEKGVINYTPYDIITLTRKGRQLAQEAASRHDALRNFLVKVLAVDETEAEEVAHRLEHPIPRKIIARLIRFEEFAEKCLGRVITGSRDLGTFATKGDLQGAANIASPLVLIHYVKRDGPR